MAISYVQSTNPAIVAGSPGTAYQSANPTTFSYFTGTVGNLFLAIVGLKPDIRQTTAPSIFTGSGGTSTGGTGTYGGDSGTVRMYLWHRTVDGTEPASDTLTWDQGTVGTASPAIMTLHEFSRTNVGAWDVAHAFGSDMSQSTGVGAIVVTAATNPGYTVGDMAVVAFFAPTDAGVYASPVLTIPGCTVAALTLRADYGTTAGNDAGLQVWTAPITAGTASGSPQLQCDVDALNASAGLAVFVRLREPTGVIDSVPPAVPVNLNVDSVTYNSATLSWDASTDNIGVAGYRLYQDGLLVADLDAVTTTIFGLTPQTMYDFTISAYDASANESSQSAAVVATTNSAPPTILTDRLVYDGTTWNNLKIEQFDGTSWS
jgi:hypothetical protein